MTSKKVFIAPLNWGLGHATRLLPLVRKFLDQNYTVFIGASDRSKEILKKEVKDCVFLDFPEYPIKYPRTRFFVTRFMLLIFPMMLIAMRREHKRLKELHKKYQFQIVISDNRFSLALKGVPSYLISHQLRYILPWPIKYTESLSEYFNFFHFRKYDKIIVPDVETDPTLTGQLSHNMRYLARNKLYYAGIFSDVVKIDNRKNESVNYLVIVSGPEPQRTYFEELIFRQVHVLKGQVIVALGIPEKKFTIKMGNAIFYTYLNRDEMSYYLNNANFIISRPGYTTVMEMVEFGKRGLFVPTPGQVEQEYLAKHFMEMGWCHMVKQHKCDLETAEKKAQTYPGFPKNFTKISENVDRMFDNIFTKSKM
jgi:uncharacterized protein (TIGR00661 family)